MAASSFIPQSGDILDFTDVAPSPCKDFCQIKVNCKDDKNKGSVIYRCWKITPRAAENKVAPSEVRETFEEFLEDDRQHSEIHRVFGPHMLDYVMNLVKGHIDYLPRLPEKVLLHILSYLELEDIPRMAQVNKKFHELSMSDDLWEKIYRSNSEAAVTEELVKLAEEVGWRKLFFTNKLQLQVQLNRVRKRKVSDMSTDEEEEPASDSVQLRRQARKRSLSAKGPKNASNNSGDTVFLTEELD